MRPGIITVLFFVTGGLLAQQPAAPAATPASPATPVSASKPFARPAMVPAFGEFAGRLGWEQAVKQCAEQKMRLPTAYELRAAYEAGVLKTWDPQGWYWTSSDDADTSMAMSFLLKFGQSQADSKGHGNYVRCVKPQ